MKQLFLLLIFAITCFAQYSPEDEQLVRQTFLRELDESTVASYYYSFDERKIKALLLSLANTQNTDFTKIITQLDMNQYGKELVFALGYLDTDYSRSFLVNSILSNTKPDILPVAFDALGKIGTKKEYELIGNAYGKLSKQTKAGMAIFLTDLYMRGIIQADSLTNFILTRELNSNNVLRIREALYANYRIGANPEYNKQIVDIIKSHQDSPVLLQYAISSLRKSGFSSYDKQLLDLITTHNDWRVRCEASALLPQIKVAENMLFSYATKLLNDRSEHVSIRLIQAFASDDNIEKKSVAKYFGEELKKNFSPDVKGELVNLIADTDGQDPLKLIKLYQKDISQKSVFRLIQKIRDSEKCFNILVDSLSNLQDYNTPYYLDALMSLQEKLSGRGDYLNLVFEFLGSDNGANAAIVAVNIDSSFAKSNKNRIAETINSSIIKNYDNDDFTETFLVFADLSGKIDSATRNETINRLTGVSIPAVKMFVLKELNKESERTLYSTDYFEDMWVNSFKYKTAVIKTNRGNFTIKLIPEVAPISVGNFVMLAEKGYYNNVKFHRVVPNFVIQTGDPTGTGWGGPGYSIISEFSYLKYTRGMVGMASAGRDTEGSQWFVTHSEFPHLNGRYTIFGEVTQGMDVVDKVQRNDIIRSIDLIK